MAVREECSFNQLFSFTYCFTGVAGLYDYGPSGTALMNNIISVWRNHFVLEEEMLELDTSIMTTYDVLKTSGHVDKFADWMCKDLKNGEIFRADHVIEAVLEARLQGDREARAAKEGKTLDPKQEADKAKDAKKKKKKGVVVAVELADGVRKTYEETLAQVRIIAWNDDPSRLLASTRLITTAVRSLPILSRSLISALPNLATSFRNLRNSISCLKAASALLAN